MFVEKLYGSSYAQAKREETRLDSSLIQTGLFSFRRGTELKLPHIFSVSLEEAMSNHSLQRIWLAAG